MAWRLSPQLRILAGQNLAGKAFFVETGDFKDVVFYDGPDALGGFAIYVAGFNLRKGTETSPIIDWRLHAGNTGLIDDEPVASGATFLLPGKTARQGLLFEVRGRDATSWLLRARCRTIAAAYELGASVTVSPLPAGGTGSLSVTVGTVIG